MDKLSIFSKGDININSEENNTIDTVVQGLGDIKRELMLTRKGNEAFVYGEPVEDSDEVDLEDIAPEEVDND